MKKEINIDVDQVVEAELRALRRKVRILEARVQAKDYTIASLKSGIAANKKMVDDLRDFCTEHAVETW